MPSLKPTAQPGLRTPLGFQRASWITLAALAFVVVLLVTTWPQLAAAEWHAVFDHADWWRHVDWLLAGLGVFFLFCTAFDAHPGLDLATVLAGMAGGTIIEIWGTRAGVWFYYTHERPPLWILPAWGMSALCNERLQRLLASCLTPTARERLISDPEGSLAEQRAYALIMTAVLAFFLWWARFYLFHPATFVVTALIVSALWSRKFPAYALSLFFTGALLGVFLEIWGTTRHCWNYYDGKTPSPFPIFGHGMAALCFWKMKNIGRALLERAEPAWTGLFFRSLSRFGRGR